MYMQCESLEDFFKRFDGLDSRILRIKDEILNQVYSKDIGEGEEKVRGLEFAKIAIAGLKNTSNENDLGKDRPAFYFVKGIIFNDIIKTDSPYLNAYCGKCNHEIPVVMRYEQISKVPEVWEKEAYVLCERDGSLSIAKVNKEYPFL